LGPEGIESIPEGSAHLFILPADDRRDANLVRVRDCMAAQTDDIHWRLNEHDQVKLLVIVHQRAAKRLGLGEIFTALNSKAPTAFKDGFLDGSA
ncbi:hypothetical protein ACG9XS_22265, partial [Acinetobacter gyllenbergii]|uniref:hypothetical protein n=1 Tax=Acinetobacter gyllenbergii TaxID=134534 RepID=UPI003AF87DA4